MLAEHVSKLYSGRQKCTTFDQGMQIHKIDMRPAQQGQGRSPVLITQNSAQLYMCGIHSQGYHGTQLDTI